jgi:hypothetical protein
LSLCWGLKGTLLHPFRESAREITARFDVVLPVNFPKIEVPKNLSGVTFSMSSSPNREPLTGIIRQDAKVVGAICLPEEELQDFIEQFNHCYGPLRMRVEMLPGTLRPFRVPTCIAPVGATFRQPFKPPKA